MDPAVYTVAVSNEYGQANAMAALQAFPPPRTLTDDGALREVGGQISSSAQPD
jgi:hypothetical protein